MDHDLIGNKIQDFKIVSKIGSGGFATVYKAKCLKPGYEDLFVAIKKISKANVAKKGIKKRVKEEIRIHSLLNHPSIVKLYTSFEDDKYFFLVLELCEHGTLEDFVKNNGPLPEEDACYIIKQVIQGVQDLHSRSILHRDLSLKNIMLKNASTRLVKIIDFGLATELSHPDDKKHTMLGTPNFMPPEMIGRASHGFKLDCWSLGCVLFALLVGKLPFDGKGINETFRGIRMSKLDIPNFVSNEAKELLNDFLQKEPRDRIGVNDCLHYPFFQKYEASGKRIEVCKNRDSGMATLSSSTGVSVRSAERLTGICDSGINSSDSGHMKLRQNRKMVAHIKMDSVHSSGCSYGSCNSTSRSSSSNSKSRESQVARNCTNSPLPYPTHRLQNIEEEFCSKSCYSCHNTVCSEMSNGSAFKMHNNCIRNSLLQNPSCSHHSQYCSSDVCMHETVCSCRQHHLLPKKCGSSKFHSNEREQVECHPVNLDPPAEKSLRDITPPLNSVRLAPKRHSTKNVVISILTNRQVCLEFLKVRNSIKYVTRVCVISPDGKTIYLYKPKKNFKLTDEPPPMPDNLEGVLNYSYETLPEAHWKKYQYAARFVDIIRSQTPKVTIYGKNAKCIMMENTPNPNFEMSYYDGRQITESGGKVSFTDKNGISTPFADDDRPTSKEIWDEFLLMKKKCQNFESHLEMIKQIPGDTEQSAFPVIFGRRPITVLETREMNKENRNPQSFPSSSLNKAIDNIKSFNGTIDSTGFSRYQKSQSHGTPASRCSESSAVIRNIKEILPHLKGKPKMKNGKAVAEYKDGLQMCSSLDGKDVSFYDIHAKTEIKNPVQNTLCMKKIQHDLTGILLYVIAEAKRKKRHSKETNS